MNFIKYIWIGQKGAETGLGAKANDASAMAGGWEILWVRILKRSAAKYNKFFRFSGFLHFLIHAQLPQLILQMHQL